MAYRKLGIIILIPPHLEVLKVAPDDDRFILEMEPALRQLISVRGASPADNIYMDFVQYQIAINPSSGKSRWRDYEFQKHTFGIWFMCCLDRHIDLVLRGAAPALNETVTPFPGAAPASLRQPDRIPEDQWKPMAEFVAQHPDASNFEREKFSQNLLDTYPGRTISFKQFELLEAFFQKYKRRDEARDRQYEAPPSSIPFEGLDLTVPGDEGDEPPELAKEIEL